MIASDASEPCAQTFSMRYHPFLVLHWPQGSTEGGWALIECTLRVHGTILNPYLNIQCRSTNFTRKWGTSILTHLFILLWMYAACSVRGVSQTVWIKSSLILKNVSFSSPFSSSSLLDIQKTLKLPWRCLSVVSSNGRQHIFTHFQQKFPYWFKVEEEEVERVEGVNFAIQLLLLVSRPAKKRRDLNVFFIEKWWLLLKESFQEKSEFLKMCKDGTQKLRGKNRKWEKCNFFFILKIKSMFWMVVLCQFHRLLKSRVADGNLMMENLVTTVFCPNFS